MQRLENVQAAGDALILRLQDQLRTADTELVRCKPLVIACSTISSHYAADLHAMLRGMRQEKIATFR